ncbi:hypothetical protein QUF72_03880 [Desulfobacterales bacterium HSG2]|nr:hypothetical protein [Desulfobacterales bacterium HSG2]
MKCPQCMNNQKYKEGMVCKSCKYRFALNPKKSPHIKDMAFKNAIDRVSGNGLYYFTYNQLFAQIYRLVRNTESDLFSSLMLSVCFFVFIGMILMVFLFEFVKLTPDLVSGALILYAVLVISGIVWCVRRPFKISYSPVSEAISTYLSLHPTLTYLSLPPTGGLIEGRVFQKTESDPPDEEIFQYAPERILIVERNDIADMLILNRFPLEHKTLVVSEQKYPHHAFRACQRFFLLHPEIPVILIHDASEKGLRMEERLLSDRFWNLRGKNVQDTGLFPMDTERLRKPMWLPEDENGKILCARKTADENISQGYRMPVDIASPRAMMGAVSLAAASGLALLSEEFLAEQQRDASSGTVFGGGFG